MMTMKDKDHSP